MNEIDAKTHLRQLRIDYWRCAFVCAAVTLNFAVFVVFAVYFGGDAINGKSENGHYYVFGVASNSSGKTYTEVSKEVFNYSRLHALSVLLTWPAAMAVIFKANKIKVKISALEGKS